MPEVQEERMAMGDDGHVPPPSGQSQPAPRPVKFSRYRSVRRAAAAAAAVQENCSGATDPSSAAPTSQPPLPSDAEAAAAAAAAAEEAKLQESIKRSMSRYRNRTGATAKAVTSPPPPVPATGLLAQTRGHDNGIMNANHHENGRDDSWDMRKVDSDQIGNLPVQEVSTQNGALGLDGYRSTSRQSMDQTPIQKSSSSEDGTGRHTSDWRGRAEGRVAQETVADDGRSRNQEGFVPPICQDDIRRNTEDELRANARAAARHNYGTAGPSKLVKKEGGRGGLLSRLRGIDLGSSKTGSLKNKISAPQAFDPSLLNMPAGKPKQDSPADAMPISAVNAGERRVMVVCNQSFIKLRVTPSTKVQEILYSAANCLSENIDPERSTLTEYFEQLGLERPLRKYEHIRDIMNSWDNDEQNRLIVTPQSDDSEFDSDELVDARFAPHKQPDRARTFHVYHSQQSGKWEKRWITLKPDGQVTLAKKQGATAAESTNICHMSDFDIYTPTRRMLKRLRPPKKVCYAVKSQQKASMFYKSDNFVHYFATNDQEVARSLYLAVQQWRSWYLANVLGDRGSSSKNTNHSSRTEPSGRPTVTSHGSVKNKTTVTAESPTQYRVSTESARPYQLGSFKPLLDLDPATWENPNTAAAQPEAQITNAPPSRSNREQEPSLYRGASRPPSSDAVHPPPSRDRTSTRSKSRPRKPTLTSTPQDTDKSESDEVFAPTGLLGRTYTQRQQAMKDREKQQADEGPFIKTGLLANLDASYSSAPTSPTFPPPRGRANSNAYASGSEYDYASSSRHRSKSVRHHQPKPLVDLTPTYQEPPQHARKGRGVTVEPGTFLIEAATGPEPPPGAPSSTTWRRPSMERNTASRSRSNTLRRPVTQGRQSLDAQPGYGGESPFTPGGLLARSKSQGVSKTGRGVATGYRDVVGKPLLDFSEPSQFAEGSLLKAVEERTKRGEGGS
ncbi:hypothetical protein VTO42DRAFT_595 [Malbranchea cinnamomea]